MATRDPKGFYKTLHVSPSANSTEIELSYKFLKRAYTNGNRSIDVGRIQAAYDTLSDPELRKHYDGHKVATGSTSSAAGMRSLLRSPYVAAPVAVAFLVSLAFTFGPMLAAQMTSFDAGDRLVWKKTGKPLGEVVGYTDAHSFEEGPTVPAYEVQLTVDSSQWFPAAELHRGCKVRP